jgi:hypothetical protein
MFPCHALRKEGTFGLKAADSLANSQSYLEDIR